MATPDDLEAYLSRLDRRFEKKDSTFVVSLGPNQPPALVRIASPVVVVQVDVGPAPKGNGAAEAKLFRRLLELNASDLLHVAYAIENDRIVLDAALDLDSVDLRDLEAVVLADDVSRCPHRSPRS